MTRNEARKAFADSGLTYGMLSVEVLEDLRKRLDGQMKRSELMNGSYRMRRTCHLTQKPGGRYAHVRCKSHYFDDREAVTFNPDGFIGFAGWADERNVQPILEAFTAWVEAHRPSVEDGERMEHAGRFPGH